MSTFTCETATQSDSFIVRTRGYLDEGGGRATREAVEAALPQGFRRLILNLGGSPVINSQGITQLLEIAEQVVMRRKSKLAFVGLTDLQRNVFNVMGLLRLGKAFADEAAALGDGGSA